MVIFNDDIDVSLLHF